MAILIELSDGPRRRTSAKDHTENTDRVHEKRISQTARVVRVIRGASVMSVFDVALEEPPKNGQEVERIDTRSANSVTDDATTRQGVAECLASNGSWHFTGTTVSSRCIDDLPELAEVEPHVRAGFTTVDHDVAGAEVGVSNHRALTHRAAELALELLTIEGNGWSRSAGGPGAALFDDGRKAGARDQHTSTIPTVSNRMRFVDYCRREALLADGALERFGGLSNNPNAFVSLRVRKMERAAVTAEEIAA
jgi:hypothetical protein